MLWVSSFSASFICGCLFEGNFQFWGNWVIGNDSVNGFSGNFLWKFDKKRIRGVFSQIIKQKNLNLNFSMKSSITVIHFLGFEPEAFENYFFIAFRFNIS